MREISTRIPVRSPVIKTRDGLIMAREGPTTLLKSRALSGWKTLKWRSESWTTQTTESGPPSTSMILLELGFVPSNVSWCWSGRDKVKQGKKMKKKRRRRTKPIFSVGVCLLVKMGFLIFVKCSGGEGIQGKSPLTIVSLSLKKKTLIF